MPRVLLVDDDPDQLEIRRLLFEQAGHQVWTAPDAGTALTLFASSVPQLVVTDLRLPRAEDGLALIRALRVLSPAVRIVVLSGWTFDVCKLPEAILIDALLSKPFHTGRLLRLAAELVLWLICLLAVMAPPARAAELAADLEITAGRLARVSLQLDGSSEQHLVVYPKFHRHRCSVFFASVEGGGRGLRIKKPDAVDVRILKLREVSPGDPEYLPLAHAPILYARPDTLDNFSDVPLLVYAERLTENGAAVLQYTVIFSNEDGGTSTRALMARWGRTTDIEYVYRAYLRPDGSLLRATIQARGHQEIEFRGRREGLHPFLIPSTQNNMVADAGTSPVRFQLAPLVVDLSSHSREEVMDRNPFTYRVASEELEREGKLRPHGVVDGEKISDPRNYLYLEAKVANRDGAIAALVRLQGESRWSAAHLGRADFAIQRSGWVRTTIELPPGAGPAQIAEIGFECLVAPPEKNQPWSTAGTCRLEEVSKAFFLDSAYRPGPSVWRLTSAVDIPTGRTVTFPRR